MSKKKFKKIYVEITNICNLNCSFCSPCNRKKRKMSVDEFTHILEEVKDYTECIYLHLKGEPLLHPDLLSFLDIAASYQVKVNLTTNGTIFSSLAEKLAEKDALSKINFSLHCENSEENYLESIFSSVDKLNEKITIIYRLWTMTDNILDDKSLAIVEKLKEYYHLSLEKVEELKTKNNVKIADHIYVDKDNEFEWPNARGKSRFEGYCPALKTQIGILVDGTVVPCCLDGEGKIVLGNIYQEKFSKIIQSEKFLNLKKAFQDRKPTESLCLNCTYKERFK